MRSDTGLCSPPVGNWRWTKRVDKSVASELLSLLSRLYSAQLSVLRVSRSEPKREKQEVVDARTIYVDKITQRDSIESLAKDYSKFGKVCSLASPSLLVFIHSTASVRQVMMVNIPRMRVRPANLLILLNALPGFG